jgi:hypothetical protein
VRRLKPTEIKAVAELLEAPASDTADLARDILRKVNEMRERESLWVVAVARPRREAQLFGPYLTQAEAKRAVDSGVVLTGFGDAPGIRIGYWRLQGRDEEE